MGKSPEEVFLHFPSLYSVYKLSLNDLQFQLMRIILSIGRFTVEIMAKYNRALPAVCNCLVMEVTWKPCGRCAFPIINVHQCFEISSSPVFLDGLLLR